MGAILKQIRLKSTISVKNPIVRLVQPNRYSWTCTAKSPFTSNHFKLGL